MYEPVDQVRQNEPMSSKPLYRQVADKLRQQIADGEFPPGSKLPSERDLCERFGAARNTVRMGLSVLITEGLISAGHGRGYEVRKNDVFVLDASRHENLDFTSAEDGDSYSNEVKRAGRQPHQEFRVQLWPAPADVAERLQVETGERTVLRYCRRFVDDTAWSTQATAYPMWLAENTRLTDPHDIEEGTTRYLSDLGFRQVRYRDEWSTRMPTPDEARELQLGPGVPVLLWMRTGLLVDGRAARCTVTTFRGDLNRVTYDIDLEK